MNRLKGKTAVVFGGNGDIGGEIARAFVSEGATVIPTGRNITRLKKIIAHLKRAGNRWQEPIPVDVRSRSDIRALFRKIIRVYQNIDSVVCASGIYLNKPAVTMKEKEWDKVIDVNLKGTLLVCQEAAHYMLKQQAGSIITVGSLGSFVALSNTTAYSVSKAGVVSLTQCLASEWADKNVRVNCLVPGVFPTRLNKKALAMKGRVKNILRGIPARRLGSLTELTGGAVFLASDESSYVNGISLPIDGGFLGFSGY